MGNGRKVGVGGKEIVCRTSRQGRSSYKEWKNISHSFSLIKSSRKTT